MNEELFGSLVIRMSFIKTVDDKRMYGREVRLLAFHGALDEVKEQYKNWLRENPQLVDLVQATFEMRMAIHQSDL